MNRHLHLVAPALLLGLGLALPAQQPATSGAPARHTAVTFENGLLSIQASNASLNGLLREVAKSTGMKISGSIPEDRVFGNYGPADPQRVLSTLLDGTGVNVLIVSNAAETPLELQLSPRSGAPTPPNPQAQAQQNEDADQAAGPAESGSAPAPEPINPANAKPEPSADPAASSAPSESSQPLVFPKISPSTAPATGTTTPANTDDDQGTGTEGVKTPQQIFEQLQTLQNNTHQGTPESNEQAPQQ